LRESRLLIFLSTSLIEFSMSSKRSLTFCNSSRSERSTEGGGGGGEKEEEEEEEGGGKEEEGGGKPLEVFSFFSFSFSFSSSLSMSSVIIFEW